MSWFVKTVGKPEDVKAEVNADVNIPSWVKEAVSQVCDGIINSPDPNHPHNTGVEVEGSGHFGPTDWWNSVSFFKCFGVKLAKPVPVAAPVDPPEPVTPTTS